MKEDKIRVVELLRQIKSIEEIKEIKRMGGLTNRTYLVETDTEQYVVRLPGEGTEDIIVRGDEKKSTELACSIGVDAQLYYFDEKNGEKVSEYIKDSKTMSQETMCENENIKRAAKIFKKLHTSGADTKVPFDVIDMANTYENIIKNNGGFFYDDYIKVKEYIDEVSTKYMANVNKVPCHNDPLCENWILQNDRMYLIDWEYAGMNDPMWDLADLSIEAEYNDEMDKLLLISYFDKEPNEEEWKAFKINKILIDYLWSLWGKARAVYDGEEMESYALGRYERMKKNMRAMED